MRKSIESRYIGVRQHPEFERNHIDILGEKAFYYNSKSDLEKILTQVTKDPATIQGKDWDAYSEEYSPESVMKKFSEVFLNEDIT